MQSLPLALLSTLCGALIATALDLAARLFWTSFYAHYPLEGYAGATAQGLVDPGIYMSAMGFRHAWGLYLLCGLGIGLLDRRRAVWLAALFAFGAVVVHSAFSFASPDSKDSNLAPLTPLFMTFYSLPPLLAGLVAGLLAGWVRSLVGQLRR
ncbi:MAG: hypothetical protein NDI93_05450 [Pseudomonas sp.]|nr:hypothetical protein [Pseudomonas sp.]